MKYYFTALAILLSLTGLIAQSIITTENGKRISVNEDGTWEYISNDPDELSNEVSNIGATTVNMLEDQNESSAFEIPQENVTLEDLAAPKNFNSLSKLEGDILQLLTTNRISLRNNLTQKTVLAEEINLLKSDQENSIYADTDELKAELSRVEKEIKNSQRIVKESELILSKVDNDELSEKESSEYRKRAMSLLGINAYNTPADQLTLEDFYYEKSQKTTPDLCQLIYDGYDESIKRKRKETASRFLFSYTHPKLKSHFKDKDFLNCNASLAKLDDKSFLQLNIKIASKDARKNYGKIERGAMLRILLIDGEILYTTNVIPILGDIEKYTGNTIYNPIYQLDKDQLKQLRNTEIDKIGILWTSGYEEYDIYEVDFLMNQISCLDK